MKILIADDERPARGELRYLLASFVPTATIHEARNGREVLNHLQAHDCDIVFLDINMPGVDGLSAAAEIDQLDHPPLIVFATAYSEHGVQAFELAAVDYLVKPFAEHRLHKTIHRLQRQLAERGRLQQQRQLIHTFLAEAGLLPKDPPLAKVDRLWGERENGNRVLVSVADIIFITADAKKVFVQLVAGDKLLVKHTLKELETRLPAVFVRVHKGYLVNLDHIAEVVPWFSGGYVIRLRHSTVEIPLSRRYAAQLKQLTDWR